MVNIFSKSVKISVKGVNQSRFLTEMAKSGVMVKKVKKSADNIMTFIIKIKDREKVFAITDKMCYNVTKISPVGVYGAFSSAVKNLGVILGITAFLLLSPLPNFFISDIVIEGNGSVYKQGIIDYLKDNGVEKYAPLLGKDFDELSNQMLIDRDEFSFVSIKKQGSLIIVTAILSEEEPNRLKGQTFDLYATIDGVIKEVKVYKGKALVKVGDAVKKGDLLVTGMVDINGVTVSSNVYATVTLSTQKTLEFYSNNKDFEGELSTYIKSEYGNNAKYTITKKQEKNGFVYVAVVEEFFAIVAD